MRFRVWGAFAALLLVSSASGEGACVNRFTARSQGNLQNVTLLTGKLDFGAAQRLAGAIRDKKAQPLEWVDQSGKRIAQQFGELKVIRPMRVACDGNSSGVIMSVSFPSPAAPVKKMRVKLDGKTAVEFEEQPD